MNLVKRQIDPLRLHLSHTGPIRVFFVDTGTFDDVHRPINKRFGGYQVKVHSKWFFVDMHWNERMIVEVPAVNWFMHRRYKGSVPSIALTSVTQGKIVDHTKKSR